MRIVVLFMSIAFYSNTLGLVLACDVGGLEYWFGGKDMDGLDVLTMHNEYHTRFN